MPTLFEKIAAGEIPADIVYSDDEIVAFRDINPQAPHHVLIIPRRPIPTVLDLEASDAELVGRMVLVAGQIARDVGVDAGGYRLVFNCKEDGGQEVYHIHLHLLGGRKMSWPPG
jgi:histidine triad (HIT) family protein